jgi:GNAT superfamily N-acetyltransferase
MTDFVLDPMFVNHLAFLATHRGEVALGAAGVAVKSGLPGFSSFTPWDEDATLPADAEAVRLAPGCGAGWGERLARQGWRPAEAFCYMELADDAALAARPAAETDIVVARSEADADAFAATQAAGFEAGPDAEGALWRTHLRTVARANVGRAHQTFYLVLVEGRPAAVSLTVRAGGVAGLYAVATRPEHRKAGLSTALLRRSCRDARAAGLARVVLQTMKGSYAETFYGRLGFAERSVSQVWRRG